VFNKQKDSQFVKSAVRFNRTRRKNSRRYRARANKERNARRLRKNQILRSKGVREGQRG